jgi:hypothetical protein
VARIAKGSASDLPALEPLWVAVHHAHVASMPELAPYVTDAETWAERRAHLRAGLRQARHRAAARLRADALIGYALAHVLAVEDTWIADTWRTGPRIGEVESLSVLPE